MIYNPALTNLQGLESIAQVVNITLANNQSLDNCILELICHKLNTQPLSVFAQNNSSGCNSREEIKSDCGNLSNSSGKIYVDIDCNGQFNTNIDQISAFHVLRNTANNLPIATSNATGEYLKF